jgi:hypothetical protein
MAGEALRKTKMFPSVAPVLTLPSVASTAKAEGRATWVVMEGLK